MAINLEVIDTFDFHQSPIFALTADDRYLYSAGGDRKILRYRFIADQWQAEIFAQTTESTFAMYWKEPYLLSGGIEGNLNVFNITEKQIIHRFQSHQNGIFAITSNSEFVITGGGDGKIHLWNCVNWEIARTIWTGEAKIRGFAWNHDQTLMASIDNAGFFRVFETQWWNEIYTFQHAIGLTSCVYHHKKNTWILGSKNGEIIGVQIDQTTPIFCIQAHLNAIYTLIIEEQHELLISGSLDKSVKIWNKNNLDLILKTTHFNEIALKSININLKYNDLLVIAGDNKKIHLSKICFFK